MEMDIYNVVCLLEVRIVFVPQITQQTSETATDSRVCYLDTLAFTQLSFCATPPSQGCSPVSSCTLSMFGPEWKTSREETALEEAGLMTHWVAFFPLSQY